MFRPVYRLMPIFVVAMLFLSACSSTEDSVEVDPIAAFKSQMEATAAAAEASGETVLDWANVDSEIRFDGGNTYDMRESDSLLRPYEGELVLALHWTNDGVENPDIVQRLIVYYEYDDGRWIPVSAERCTNMYGEGWKCRPGDDPDGYWLSVVNSF